MDRKAYLITIIILALLLGLSWVAWQTLKGENKHTTIVTSTAVPTVRATPSPSTPTPSPSATVVQTASPIPTATPKPAPTPPPLDTSDAHLTSELKTIQHGNELLSILTEEEIVRKLVRAVYGLSEGRIVREFRPISSPIGPLVVNKMGEQTPDTQMELYRISRQNYSRYTPYVSLLSALNNDVSTGLYRFYLPTLNSAYDELGLSEGNFHSTLIKAIDVLLESPSPTDAILLTQPTVMYKFKDPKFEKLPQAHKLMIRMGRENSEVLKLELAQLKARLETIK